MDPFQMVVAIIIVVTIGKVLNTRMKAKHGVFEDEKGNQIVAHDPDTERMRDEVKTLKERIAVLERIATDERGARDLDAEIEKLRDR